MPCALCVMCFRVWRSFPECAKETTLWSLASVRANDMPQFSNSIHHHSRSKCRSLQQFQLLEPLASGSPVSLGAENGAVGDPKP